jgi:arabinogalactan endo-1,4-beta-galactosidase
LPNVVSFAALPLPITQWRGRVVPLAGRGKGVFLWEPKVTGQLEVRGLFDANRNALPAMTVFDRFTRK